MRFNYFSRYLQEIGYTDTIIDVRSNRVRTLLGLNNNADAEDTNTLALNGNESSNKRSNEYKNTKFKNTSPRKEGGYKVSLWKGLKKYKTKV